MSYHADIDIDLANRDDILNLIQHIPAQLNINGKQSKHNSGVYIQPIPINPVTGIASIDYKEADKRSYFKLDFLNMHVYKHIHDNEHYEKLLADKPPWEKLLDPNFVNEIVHISNYYEQLKNMKPDSIIRMAMFISAIRPSKKHLLGKEWKEIEKTIWDKPKNGEYYYKKSHSIAYAQLIVIHMNIVNETY